MRPLRPANLAAAHAGVEHEAPAGPVAGLERAPAIRYLVEFPAPDFADERVAHAEAPSELDGPLA